VYLSGGEEFERLGVYELIRRRCRYIIAVDGDERGASPSADLARLVRHCRIDFGIRIEIDLTPLAQVSPDRISSARVTIGHVHYGDVDQGGMPGILVYIRPPETGDESPAIDENARDERRPPYRRPRSRDAFDERQFEYYRELGSHAASVVFGDVAPRLAEKRSDVARQSHGDYVPQLFLAVMKRWTGAANAELEG
jgi:hypothetical protein